MLKIEKTEKTSKKRYEVGIAQGKLCNQIAKEIGLIKNAIKHEIDPTILIGQLKFLNHEKVENNFEFNVSYILEHFEDSNYEICDVLGLVDVLFDESTV